MSNLTARSYHPQPDSVAGRVISYFKRFPDEELSADDIALKYSAKKSSLQALLTDAIEAGYLAKDGVIYSAGPNIGQVEITTMGSSPFAVTTVKAEEPTKAERRPRGPRQTPPALDVDNLKVDDDIPLPVAYRTPGVPKWAPFFAKLAKPGQSVPVPIAMQPALCAAARKQTKDTGTTYRVLKVDEVHCRIWRVA